MRERENLYYTILYKKYYCSLISCMYVSTELFVWLLTVYGVSYCIIMYYIMKYYCCLIVSCMYVCMYVCVCQLNCSYERSKKWLHSKIFDSSIIRIHIFLRYKRTRVRTVRHSFYPIQNLVPRSTQGVSKGFSNIS